MIWPGSQCILPVPGKSPEGHRVTILRRVLGGPLPLRSGFPAGGGPGPGGSARATKAPPAVGHDPGRLDSKAWRRAFTLRSQSHPCPPRHHTCHLVPCRDGAQHRGQERGRGTTCGTYGTGRARRWPMNRAIPARVPQQASGNCPACGAPVDPRRPRGAAPAPPPLRPCTSQALRRPAAIV
jgi:hypothetical protein